MCIAIKNIPKDKRELLGLADVLSFISNDGKVASST